MRVFIAIRFTEAFKEPIFDAQNALRDNGVRGNFTLPENLHLTLAFIGETDRVDDIKAAVKAVNFEPFEIKTEKLGCFNGRSKIVWLGIDGEKNLKTIAADLRKNLDERGIGYDQGRFQPHITLVRQPSDMPLDIDIESASMTVKKISVMKSERISGKLVYTEL
jgi:RNA 2',3'-cyclic 3'-phosphodiesterase